MPDFERYTRGVSSASQAYERYTQIHRRGAQGLNLKDWGRVLGWVCLSGSLVFWIPMEWSMASPIMGVVDALIAIAFGVYVAIGPSVIISVFLPGTRAGKLLLSLNAATPGKIAGVAAGIFLLVHAFKLMYYWWLGRIAGQAGMATEYAILGVIFTIISPALLFEPQSEAELHENLAQEHATQVYEQAAQARVNLMMQARLNAEGLMKRGLENLSANESAIVARYMRGFTEAVDQRHKDWQKMIKETSGVIIDYAPLGTDPRVADMFSFLGNLADTTAIDVTATRREIADNLQSQITAGRPVDGRLSPLPPPIAAPASDHGSARQLPPATTEAPASDHGSIAAPAAARSGPQRPTLDQGAEGESWNAYGLAYEGLATSQPFIRTDVERVLKIGKSKAGALIADWRTRGWATQVDGINNHYAFLLDVQRTGATP